MANSPHYIRRKFEAVKTRSVIEPLMTDHDTKRVLIMAILDRLEHPVDSIRFIIYHLKKTVIHNIDVYKENPENMKPITMENCGRYLELGELKNHLLDFNISRGDDRVSNCLYALMCCVMYQMSDFYFEDALEILFCGVSRKAYNFNAESIEYEIAFIESILG